MRPTPTPTPTRRVGASILPRPTSAEEAEGTPVFKEAVTTDDGADEAAPTTAAPADVPAPTTAAPADVPVVFSDQADQSGSSA